MTDQPKVTVYRTAACPFCVMAEELLRDKGVTFEEIFLDDHPDRRGFVSGLLPGHRTVPLVLVGDRPLGGFQDLLALEQSGELDRLLGA